MVSVYSGSPFSTSHACAPQAERKLGFGCVWRGVQATKQAEGDGLKAHRSTARQTTHGQHRTLPAACAPCPKGPAGQRRGRGGRGIAAELHSQQSPCEVLGATQRRAGPRDPAAALPCPAGTPAPAPAPLPRLPARRRESGRGGPAPLAGGRCGPAPPREVTANVTMGAASPPLLRRLPARPFCLKRTMGRAARAGLD